MMICHSKWRTYCLGAMSPTQSVYIPPNPYAECIGISKIFFLIFFSIMSFNSQLNFVASVYRQRTAPVSPLKCKISK